jgi:threonine 3-dehydrogenase
MSVLVTGGAGFVGAEVVRSLLRGGHSEVVVFDAAAEPTRLTDIADDVEYIRGDLGDFTHVLDAVSAHKPEVIYHLGGMLSLPCEADPSAAMRVNAMGTFHVLEAAGLFDVRQVLFTSSIGTYGYDMPGDVIDDRTLQRPFYFYGATKLFGEHMGLFYRRKHGIDFRGIRYPSVIGPGVKTPGAVQYTSWMIEESVNGRPFTVDSSRDTRVPVMYYKDAAAAIVQLAGAPAADIKMVSYLVVGATPVPSAGDLADAVATALPDASITFDPDPYRQLAFDQMLKPGLQWDESCARDEWGWQSTYSVDAMVHDFVAEIRGS